jgi:hypothetical protein
LQLSALESEKSPEGMRTRQRAQQRTLALLRRTGWDQRMSPARCRVLLACLLWAGAMIQGCAFTEGCAMNQSSGSATLKTEEFMIPSRDAGIQLYLRNKAPGSLRSFSPEKTLLFVHGATYPSEVVFDLGVGEGSWMEYIAQRGYDVYSLDVRGYGRSTRPAAMSAPPEANPPFARTEEAVSDISAAVEFILQRRGLSKLNLMGWSWGTTTTALYSTRQPEKVAKLVLHAPVFTPAPQANPAATGAGDRIPKGHAGSSTPALVRRCRSR